MSMRQFIDCMYSGESIDGFVEFRIGGVRRGNCRWTPMSELSLGSFPQNVPEAFFGPAVRKESGVFGKVNFKCSHVCWVDIDNLIMPDTVLPPTAVVRSGHGWHFYWRLDKWCDKLRDLETVNTALAESINADHCQNADRIMRIPGTVNAKDPDNVVKCSLVEVHPGREYTLASLYRSSRLDHKTVKKIVDGDMRGFMGDRSRRDQSILYALAAAKLTEKDVITIFGYHKCGDKFRDPDTDDPIKYLMHSFRNAQQTASVASQAGEFVADKSGYYAVSKGGRRRLSTFTFEPRALLEWDDGTEDYFLCNVCAAGTDRVWTDVQIPMHAFNNGRALSEVLNKGEWTWFGKDSDLRRLRAHVMEQLQSDNLPRIRATGVVGRHEVGGEPYFVTQGGVVSLSDDPIPIMYVDPQRESPVVCVVNTDVDPDFLRNLADVLPRLNEPEVMWPLIGWFMATPFKPVLENEQNQYRFPALNVFGTRGSGKTSVILRVFQPLLGYAEERSYDSNTTRFVTLTLLGSTNAVPVAFSEFRVATTTDFTRYILLAYDTGRDPRGRADQTTTDYPLTAPFSIDGEDMVEDPAATERVLAVRMIPTVIEQGSDAWSVFEEDLQGLGDLHDFAGPYIRYTLGTDVGVLLDTAEQDIWDTYVEELPNRVRRNLVVTWFGILAFGGFMRANGIECAPDNGAEVLRECLENVYSVKLGRTPTEADAFVELIVNAAARGGRTSFPWESDGDVMWFQLMPAFEFYMNQRSHQRRSTLTRRAIKMQLLELVREYVVEPEVRVLKGKNVFAYGVHLLRAHEAGLDVPTTLKSNQYVIEA